MKMQECSLCRVALTTVLLVLFTCPVNAAQQSTDQPANVEADEGSASKVGSAIPQVTVRAQRRALEKQAQSFVKKITGSVWAPDDAEHLLGLWRQPVCPIVAGLPREQGEFIFNRVTEVVTFAGAHPGASGCHPNLYIVVTNEPEVLITAWYKRDRRMLGHPMAPRVKKFFKKQLPVRIWYNTQLSGEGGEAGGTGHSSDSGMGTNIQTSVLADIPIFKGGTGSKLGTRLQLGAVHDLASVVVVVDFSQMEGMGWGQLADYIAMAALTNVDSDSDFKGVPSILALFDTAVESRPAGLSDWDRAYLKALYHTDRMSPLQRLLISEDIVRELGDRFALDHADHGGSGRN